MILGKSELLAAIAPTNRGLIATPTGKQAILSAIARLEDRNPTPQPLTAPELLDGNWKLLYTTSEELLGIGRFPVITLGNIYQCIRVADRRLYNLAEVNTLPYLGGLISVTAQFEAVSAIRVNVRFDRAIFGLQRFLGYQSPNQFIATMQSIAKFNPLQGVDFTISADRAPGWLEVTYLDKDLRMGRGNQGSVFVLRKV
jgi:hypothetical protein